MKKSYLLIIAFLVSGSLVFTSCNDDSSGGPGTGGTTDGKTCKILTSDDGDGEKTTYTWDGSNLVKISIDDEGDLYETNFTYENGKLKSVEEDESTNFILTWDGSNVSKVEARDYNDNELYGYIMYEYSNGVLKGLKVYEHYEAPEMDTLIETYGITYNGSNVAKVELEELGDDGKLESTGSIQISALDDKNNPFYQLPTLFTSEYDDVSVLNKNNMTSLSLVTPFGPLPVSIKYEYNEDGYPVKTISTALGETDTATATYKCE